MVKKLSPEDIARMKRIGENIKRLREHRGLTQEELAEQLEVSRSYIGRLESGNSSFGSRAEKKFSKFFRVDMNEFYRDAESLTYKEKALARVQEMFDLHDEEAIEKALPMFFELLKVIDEKKRHPVSHKNTSTKKTA